MKEAAMHWLQRNMGRRSLLLVCIGSLTVGAAAQFETRSSSAVLNEPTSIAVGDFNHDGKLDIAVALFYTSQVAVQLGNGDGTFQAATYYEVDSQGGSVSSVAVADFNQDGKLDIAAVDRLSNNVYIMLGNGDGTFQSPTAFPTIGYPFFVAVGNFTPDHIPDLVAANSMPGCDCINVLLGNGDGTFQAPIVTDTGNFLPAAIGVGDFNRDGNLDVAWAGQYFTTSEVTILLGNGDGTFQTGASYTVGASPQSIAVADFRGNGDLDLAVADGFGEVWILLGNGDGTFQPAVGYHVGEAGTVQAADFNGDGKLDLVVVNAGAHPSTVSVLLGNGDGTFQSPVAYPYGIGDRFVAVGDFNGDHKTDLVVADYLGNETGVLLNTGVVSFSPTTPLSFNAQLLGTNSPPHTVTLTNTGTTTVSITSMSVSKPFLLGSQTSCGTSVAQGASCTLSVIFQPTVMGLKTGLLVLNDSASSRPQVIALSGTGTTLTVAPKKLNFGSQKVGTKSAPQNVTVTNTGKAAVAVTGVTMTGYNPYDYSQTNSCGSQINPGATCTISVTFTPILKGTRSAVAVINGPGGVEWQGVQLIGTGI